MKCSLFKVGQKVIWIQHNYLIFLLFSTLNVVFTNFMNYKNSLKLVTQLSYNGRTGMEAVRTASVNTQCNYVGLEQYQVLAF